MYIANVLGRNATNNNNLKHHEQFNKHYRGEHIKSKHMNANTAHNTVLFLFCFVFFKLFSSVTHPFQWTVTQLINVLLKQ